VASPARVDLTEDVPAPAVWFAGRLPADVAGSRELAAAEIAAAILGGGETSRLHRRLVREDEIALSAGLGINTLVAGNSLGVASVRAVPGVQLDTVATVVAEIVGRLASEGPTELELAIALAQAERSWLDDMATAAGRADGLSGCALLYDDPEALNDRLPILRSLTAEEVRAAGARWLVPMLNAQLRINPSGAETA
jgi:predicted Zn-dependent peptidase